MNERIRQLAEQAGFDIEEGGHIMLHHVYLTNRMENFAQSIIQECADIVEQAKNSPFVSLDDAKRMSHFVDVTTKKIRQHFGVEE